jgi:SAM-dependent methyltransferase
MMQQVEAFGIDIDPDNISWAKQNLPAIDFRIGPLLPPTDYPDGSFDLVYGISVMTHLTRAVQIAWLREIERILEPGGLALLTFAGDTSVAFNSQYLTLEWLADYRLRGLGADLPSKGSGGRHRRSHLLQKCRYRSEGGH